MASFMKKDKAEEIVSKLVEIPGVTRAEYCTGFKKNSLAQIVTFIFRKNGKRCVGDIYGMDRRLEIRIEDFLKAANKIK